MKPATRYVAAPATRKPEYAPSQSTAAQIPSPRDAALVPMKTDRNRGVSAERLMPCMTAVASLAGTWARPRITSTEKP